MQIAAETICVKCPLHGLREMPDGEHVVLHLGRSLVAVAWSNLLHTPAGSVAELPAPGFGRVIAKDVAVDNAWAIHPKSGRVFVARGGHFQSIDALGPDDDQEVTVSGLAVGTFAAAFDPSGRYILLTIVRPLNPDFAEYGVAVADLSNGGLTVETSIGSTAELELLCLGGWPRPAWAIGDTANGTLWRWDASQPAARFNGPPAPNISGVTFERGESGVIATTIITQRDGTHAMIWKRVDRDSADWPPPTPLNGPPVTLVRLHPSRRQWACLAGFFPRQEIQLRTSEGLLASGPLRSATPVERVCWSSGSPDRIWAWGYRSLSRIALSA